MSHFDNETMQFNLAVAESWTEAMRAGDRTQIERLLAADVIMWRNVTRAVQPRAELVDLAVGLSKALPGFHYADIRRTTFADGFVQQHLIKGQGPSGAPFEAPACIVCRVRDGQICTMDEYYDSAQDPR